MLKVALNTIPPPYITTQQGIYFFYFSIVTINVTLITINILMWHALALSCVVITLVESQLLYITIISLEVIFMFLHAKLISDLIQHCCLRCHLVTICDGTDWPTVCEECSFVGFCNAKFSVAKLPLICADPSKHHPLPAWFINYCCFFVFFTLSWI